MATESTPSESFAIGKLSKFYQWRTKKLRSLALADVLNEIDGLLLIESVDVKSAPDILEALTAKRLTREDNKARILEVSPQVIDLLRDADIVSNRIEYETALAHTNNRLCREFIPLFCNADGSINWEALVQFNSGKTERRKAYNS
jgi:hypothetical protein